MNRNWDLIGHDWAVHLLKQHIIRHEVRHAYLFTGPPGLGKRTLALRFAQALNCVQPVSPGEPCGKCRLCVQFEKMSQADLSLVQAEDEGGMIKVEQIRNLQHTLSLTPYEAHYRIALLLRFHEANASAQNALLKTLEEAPDKVILLLTAEASENLLPTITSRCEVLRLHPLTRNELFEALKDHWHLEAEEALRLADLANGRPGFALYLHDNPMILEQRRGWIEDLQLLLKKTNRERFVYAESISKDKEKLRQALQVWLSYWRDVLLCASGSNVQIVNREWDEDIRRTASKMGLAGARACVSGMERSLVRLDANVNPRLLTEVLLLDFQHFD